MTIETARRASLEFVCVFGQDALRLGHARLSPAIQRGTGYPQRLAGFRGLSNPSRQLLGRRPSNRSRRSLGDSGGSPEARRLFLGSRASFPPERDDASGAHSHARVP